MQRRHEPVKGDLTRVARTDPCWAAGATLERPSPNLTREHELGPCDHGLSERGGVHVRVAKSFEETGLDARSWDEEVAALGGSVYMTWDWLLTWWAYYGAGRELRLVVCSAGGRVVALFPVYIDNLGTRPLLLRVARLVGAHIPPKVFDPPVAREWADACFMALVRQLIEADDCDVLSLGPVSSTTEAWRSLPGAVARSGAAVRVEVDDRNVHTLFLLPRSHDDYLGSLSRNEQKQRRKYELRTLKKEHEVSVELISGPQGALEAAFDEFAPLHARQWDAEGKSGHFGAWPNGLAYNRALVRALGPLDRVRFVRIKADGATVASQYIYAFAGRWYWELPARVPGPDWDRFSLGPSGIVTMIGEAIASGVHWIQGGLAHYDYKLRLQADEHPVLTYRIYRLNTSSKLRNGVFEALRRLFGLCYHKLWYRRVIPRLPARCRRPQWTLWLRFDY